MKTLLLIVARFDEEKYKELTLGLKEKGVELRPIVYEEEFVPDSLKEAGAEVLKADNETLIATDSSYIYNDLRSINKNAVCIAYEERDIDRFKDARYIVLSPWEAEPLFFERVWMRFNDIPWTVAVTDRLILRETIETDVYDFYEMYKDPSMTRYTEKLYEDVDAEIRYIREYRDKVYAVQGFGIWTVLRREDLKIIGRVGLITRAGFDDVEIGYAIGTAYQHKGYAKEAVLKCIEFAKELDYKAVYALTAKENASSMTLLRTLGFEYEKECTVDGTDVVKMTLKL